MKTNQMSQSNSINQSMANKTKFNGQMNNRFPQMPFNPQMRPFPQMMPFPFMMQQLPNVNHLTDCYFFIEKTCTKGDKCLFRHPKEAKKNNIVCVSWLNNRCFNKHCNLLHPTRTPAIQKTHASRIPCYFLNTPQGCTKKDKCPFYHGSVPKPSLDYLLPSNKKKTAENVNTNQNISKVKSVDKKTKETKLSSSIRNVKQNKSGITITKQIQSEQSNQQENNSPTTSIVKKKGNVTVSISTNFASKPKQETNKTNTRNLERRVSDKTNKKKKQVFDRLQMKAKRKGSIIKIPTLEKPKKKGSLFGVKSFDEIHKSAKDNLKRGNKLESSTSSSPKKRKFIQIEKVNQQQKSTTTKKSRTTKQAPVQKRTANNNNINNNTNNNKVVNSKLNISSSINFDDLDVDIGNKNDNTNVNGEVQSDEDLDKEIDALLADAF